jgi:hypothetical protein
LGVAAGARRSVEKGYEPRTLIPPDTE